MDSSWIDATLAWIAAHPVLAGAVIFLIAFCDAVIILGAIVPALPLLFAVGVFIGLGQISGPYAVAAAALGAFAGDGISYWIGRRWGDRLRGVWPFSRYPQLLDRGENWPDCSTGPTGTRHSVATPSACSTRSAASRYRWRCWR